MREFDLERSLWDVIVDLFYSGLYIYSIIIMASYLILALISFISVRDYLNRSTFVEYKNILNTPIAPSVSILAPAYNESATIIDNIRSLLSVHYSHFEVIVINDGSKDDSLEKCIEAYQLEKVDFAVNEQLKTKPVRGVYKSTNQAYKALVFVDKENGGKSDALNVGINVSSCDYITCIDVDCVLEQDALLKIMKPFVDETDAEVIATGGVIRIANSCVIEDGRLLKVNVPKNFLARTQTLEYIRAFLLGRMAWSHLDGLLLISGALGVFKKKLAIEVGGYDTSTVGEDMELVVRMRRYMREKKRKYTVGYIPDPLCWTEAPESWSILARQRNRWTRGTIETLWKHKRMFFNPLHGRVGLLSYPYWFFFEWLAPLLEFFGILLFFLLALVGLVNWSFFFLMIFLVYGFTVTFSVLSLLIEEITYSQYEKITDVFRLLQVGLLEPFLFHPFIVFHAVKGNIDYVLGKSNWGKMTRKGFTPSQVQGKKITVITKALSSTKLLEKFSSREKLQTAASFAVFVIITVVFLYLLMPRESVEVSTEDQKILRNAPKEKQISMVEERKERMKERSIEERENMVEKVKTEGIGALINGEENDSTSTDEGGKKEQSLATEQTEKPSEATTNTKEDKKEEKMIAEEKTVEENKTTEADIKEPIEKPKKVLKEKTTASTSAAEKYHIIVGSYSEEKWAIKYRDELKKDGYNANIFQRDNKFRVSISSFASKQDALKTREQMLQDNIIKSAWVWEEN